MINKKVTLPYNLLAERIILTSIMNYQDSINFVSQILPVEAFYLNIHQIIYKAALAINAKQESVDFITITTWLQDNNFTENIGGLKTLIQLSEKIISFINLKEYTKLVKEKYIRRVLINFGKEVIEMSYQTNLPIELIFNKIYSKILNLTQKNNVNNILNAYEILTDIFSKQEQSETNFSVSGYLSQFSDLDAMMEGFQKSDLIIIAGRPSVGKTAFSLNIAFNICFTYKFPVIFFSLEMTKYQLVYRLLAIKTEIMTSRLKFENLTYEEWSKTNDSLKNLSSLHFYIDDTSNISLTEIYLKIQTLKLKIGTIGLIVIDYLQLLKNVKKSETRVQEISQITRTLKGFAKEFDVPIIALSQLSRNVETRTDKRPLLSDLRESGCISLQPKVFLNYKTKKNLCKIFSLFNFQLKKQLFFTIQITGFKTVFNIKTKFNLYIFSTSNHKLLYQLFWLKLSNIQRNFNIKINLSIVFKTIFYTTILNDTVKKINYKTLTTVFDFQISKNKNFLRNGFILHNSIEQDADVVLMLYRDDYYDKISVNENIVEIIIGKQRNGPTGTIKLYFNKYLTKFFNFNSSTK